MRVRKWTGGYPLRLIFEIPMAGGYRIFREKSNIDQSRYDSIHRGIRKEPSSGEINWRYPLHSAIKQGYPTADAKGTRGYAISYHTELFTAAFTTSAMK
jgi:hypothetical protein